MARRSKVVHPDAASSACPACWGRSPSIPTPPASTRVHSPASAVPRRHGRVPRDDASAGNVTPASHATPQCLRQSSCRTRVWQFEIVFRTLCSTDRVGRWRPPFRFSLPRGPVSTAELVCDDAANGSRSSCRRRLRVTILSCSKRVSASLPSGGDYEAVGDEPCPHAGIAFPTASNLQARPFSRFVTAGLPAGITGASSWFGRDRATSIFQRNIRRTSGNRERGRRSTRRPSS